jgi:hypothetical protein
VTATDREVEYGAPALPGLARLCVTVRQRDAFCTAEARAMAATFEATTTPTAVDTRGLPGYTVERAAGARWRSRFDVERHLIVVKSGRRDVVLAARRRALPLRCRGPALRQGARAQERRGCLVAASLERMIERSLRAEDELEPG